MLASKKVNPTVSLIVIRSTPAPCHVRRLTPSGLPTCVPWCGTLCREDEKALTPEEKLERSRVRNRDHSRKSRQRKKALVEGMKKQVYG